MAKKKSGKRSEKKEKTNTFFNLAFVVVILLGIALRLIMTFFNKGLGDSEYLFASDIFSREYWGLFNPLASLQTAPPLFSCLVKLFAIKEGALSEVSLKFVPLISGVGSVFAFYFLLKNILVNRFAILLGLILFAFNPMLIKCSYLLKPYSTDVLIAICLLIYFIKYNPEGYWRQFCQMLGLSSLMLLSLPSFFTLCGGLVWILVKDFRKFLYASMAFVLFCVFYFVYHLWGVMEMHGAALDGYWTNFFVTQENMLQIVLNFIKDNLNYNFINPLVALLTIGVAFLFTCIRDKKFAFISAMVFMAVFVASYLHLYPIGYGLSLFLVPYLLVVLCVPIDFFISLIKCK